VQLIDQAENLVSEYFTPDRVDAINTADRMLSDQAARLGVD
jgi:hypothetical protein